mmetsp:Transcript_30406/g.76888  ORF Transcript_30406/g.76888 Transcript_30406/m.76888 type:complete len:202 (+) Transcript_30406:874-1479(+)
MISLQFCASSAKFPSAPAAFFWATMLPFDSNAIKGSMPPLSATASLLSGIVAKLCRAPALVSLAAALPLCSKAMRCGIAPASATATLLSMFLWHNVCKAPAAFALAVGLPAPNKFTKGLMALASVMSALFFPLAARFHNAAAACSCASPEPSLTNVTSGGMTPASAMEARFDGDPKAKFSRAAAALHCVSAYLEDNKIERG